MPEISIIVVSYNTREMTLECLRSVVAETRTTDYELIVVDNASADGSAAAIAAEFPAIRLMALEENIGFARANNLAAESARGKRLLLLNPDTVVLDRALDRLVEFADSRPAARIWGGRTLFADRSLNPGSCWGAMSVWGLVSRTVGLTMLFPRSEFFNPEPYGGWQRDSVREVDIVTGCLLLIDRPLWDELGAFDPRFFMYGEEADLCIRAIARGATPVITPTAEIVHYGSASDTGNKASAVAAARVTLIREHWSPLARRAGIFLSWASALTHHVAYATATKLLPRRARLRESARMHSGVWHDRHRWLPGY
jgi:N-acetylglucosaminyl-diphospho-decaprenol L-rhamnosyltransferase